MRGLALVFVGIVVGGCYTINIVPAPTPPVLAVDEGPPGHAHPPAYPGVIGHWAGVGHQYNNGQDWDFTMEISAPSGGPTASDDDEVIGTIDYPGIGCGGELVRVREEGGTAVLRERLTRNPSNVCVDGGTIRMALRDDNTLDWRWYYADGGEGASSLLTR